MTHIDVYYEGDLSTRCIHSDNGSEVLTDAPKENQGLGRFFSPTDLFAASFGSCMMTIIGFTAKRLNVDIKGMRATVTKEMADAPPGRRIGRLHIVFTCPHRFSDEVTQKLTQATASCAVHKSLHPDIIVEINYRWGES